MLAAGASIEPSPDDGKASKSVVAPVVVDGIILFDVRGVSAFPAERRAKEITARIEQMAANRTFDPESLQVVEKQGKSSIEAGDEGIMLVIDEDARLENIERKVLAGVYLIRIREAIMAYCHARTPGAIIRSAVYIAVATIAFVVFLWLGQRAMRRIDALLDSRLHKHLEGVESQALQIVRDKHKQLLHGLLGARRLLWFAACAFVGLWYIEFSLGILPWTRWLGHRLYTLLLDPLRIMSVGLIDAIPDFIFLTMLFFIVRYFLKVLRLFFVGVAEGTIGLRSFAADWAWPTYKLLRVFVIAFALVVAFTYIPGSNTDAFKGISVFVGIIISLGSSSVIANIIAGYTMVYRRAFKVGDRIRVGDEVGDVTETRLLVTYLRTPKNEEIVVPNTLILSRSVVNYSTLAREGKLILHTIVGIGYETPWRQVEAMLLQAAAQTPEVKKDPSPFVLQKDLGNFSVTYELNVFCDDTQKMGAIYTALHRNILDVFNENGVQIMTPSYESDPPEAKVVPKERWFVSPVKRDELPLRC